MAVEAEEVEEEEMEALLSAAFIARYFLNCKYRIQSKGKI